MKTLTFLPPTPRRPMSKARRTRIFLSRNGVCGQCGLQIRDGDEWQIEHPEALNLGGSDDDADLWPVHVGKKDCHAPKTAVDRKLIADRNTKIDRGYAGKKGKRGFRGWRKFSGEIVWNKRSVRS